MWALWITAALAHSPHDVATVLDIEGQRLLSNDSDMLAYSEDGGRSYSYEGWLGDLPACAWLVAVGAAVADPDLGIWTWDGQDFAPTAVEEGVLACARGSSGRLLAATASGLWSSDDGLSWRLEEEGGSWGRLELWEEGWRADAEGALLQRGAEGWAPAGVEGVLALALWEGELWVGTEAGLLRGGEEGLVEVAEAPAGLRVLHAGAQGLWGATAEEGGWFTQDGLSWAQRAEGLDPLAEGGGGPHDGIHYFRYAEAGDALWFGTFEGLYRWSEERQAWTQAALDTVPRVRSTAWLADGRLLVGAYGGGVYRGRPGSAEWAEISAGVGWPWPKQVIAADEVGEELWVVSGSALYHSLDGGLSWETAPVGLAEAGDMVVLHPDWPERPVVLVGGHDSEGRGAVARSADGGRRWSAATLPGDCPNKPRALSWGEGLWLACGVRGELYSSEDEGQSWTVVDRLGSEILSMDLGADGALWLGTEAGLVSRSAGGRPTRVGEEAPVLAVRALRDGGLIWAEASGLHRLEAGGGLPEALGWPARDVVEELQEGPEGQLSAATRSGAWWSADGGRSWSLATPYDRLDDEEGRWWFVGGTLVSREGATRSRVRRLEEGGSAAAELEGAHVLLRGWLERGSSLRWTVDGLERRLEGPAGPELDQMELEPGWHELQVEVESGALDLDGLERWTVSLPTEPAPTRPKEDCGCGTGAPSAVLWLWALPLFRSRRRQP